MRSVVADCTVLRVEKGNMLDDSWVAALVDIEVDSLEHNEFVMVDVFHI